MSDTLSQIKVVRFAPNSPGGHRIRQAIMATTMDLIRAERELPNHWRRDPAKPSPTHSTSVLAKPD